MTNESLQAAMAIWIASQRASIAVTLALTNRKPHTPLPTPS